MLLIEWFLFAVLAAAALAGAAGVVLVVRDERRRRLRSVRRGVLCDVGGGVGISLLCTDVSDLCQIADLLDTEYPRCETVLVLDGRQKPEEFRAVVAAYHLFRVDYRICGELPATGVRGLYRSRSRSFRRLVLIDRASSVAADDLDAAAGVAAYDYLMPVGAGQYLLPRAVERLAGEVAEHRREPLQLLRIRVGVPAVLVHRDAVIAAGGFSGRILRHIPRRARLSLYEPFLYRPAAAPALPRRVWTVPALLLAAAVGAAAWFGLWITASVFLTGAFLWAAAAYVGGWVSPRAHLRSECLAALKGGSGKKGVNNFTMS